MFTMLYIIYNDFRNSRGICINYFSGVLDLKRFSVKKGRKHTHMHTHPMEAWTRQILKLVSLYKHRIAKRLASDNLK